jgi:hypothetical protein
MIFRTIFAQPKYPSNLQPLYDLAGNLWALWNYDSLALFYRIDAQLFRQANHNPIKFLYSLSREKLDELSRDEGFLFELHNVWDRFQKYLQYPGTYRKGCDLECQLDKGQTVTLPPKTVPLVIRAAVCFSAVLQTVLLFKSRIVTYRIGIVTYRNS